MTAPTKIEVPDTMEFAEILVPSVKEYTPGYRRVALRWTRWSQLFFVAVFSGIGLFGLFAEKKHLAFFGLLSLYLVPQEIFWRLTRFCPVCEALARRPLWREKNVYCAGCGHLLD